MAEFEDLSVGQRVTVDMPNAVRHLLPISMFRVTSIEDTYVHLRSEQAFPEGVVPGTPVVLWALSKGRPIEGLVVANLAPAKLILSVEPLPERREHQRAPLSIDGELQLLDDLSAYPVRFTTVDVSEGGMAIRVTTILRAGDRGFVTLDFGGSPILAIAEVIECKGASTYFDVRLRFTSMSDAHRLRLARVLLQAAEILDEVG